MTIAILCPSRKRPKQFDVMVESAKRTSGSEIEIYLGIDVSEIDDYQNPGFLMIQPDGMPTVHKWNLLAREAMKDPDNKLFMLGSDDTVFTTPLWDKALIEHYNALENKIHVYALQDSRDVNGIPHPIVTREYIEAMGWMLPPIFLHWFVDLWTVEIAKANNCFTHMKDYMLEHRKPSDQGRPDETHSRIREWGWHNRDKFVNETCQYYLEVLKRKIA